MEVVDFWVDVIHNVARFNVKLRAIGKTDKTVAPNVKLANCEGVGSHPIDTDGQVIIN